MGAMVMNRAARHFDLPPRTVAARGVDAAGALRPNVLVVEFGRLLPGLLARFGRGLAAVPDDLRHLHDLLVPAEPDAIWNSSSVASPMRIGSGYE
jgi:hypothetical protein